MSPKKTRVPKRATVAELAAIVAGLEGRKPISEGAIKTQIESMSLKIGHDKKVDTVAFLNSLKSATVPAKAAPEFPGCDDPAGAAKAWSRLNPKRRLFCEQYVFDCNAAQAAIRAGYSKKTARTQGSQLLTMIDVQVVVAAHRAGRSSEAIMTFDERAEILSDIARGRLGNFFDEGNELDLDPNAVRAAGPELQEVAKDESMSDDGKGRVHSSKKHRIKVRDPVGAIRELNEMYGDHAPRRLRIGTDHDDAEPLSDAVLEKIARGGK